MVVAFGMHALNGLGEQRIDCPVPPDIVVIATLAVLILATFYQRFHAEGFIAPVGHAVDNKVLHILQFFHSTLIISLRIHAALHTQCSNYTSKDGDNHLNNLLYRCPITFHIFSNFIVNIIYRLCPAGKKSYK